MYERSIADRIAGAIFVVMGIVCLVEGWRMFPMRTRGIVGDEAFPIVLGVVMVGLGGILALFPKPQKQPVFWPKGKQALVMAESVVILVLYWFLMKYLGFPVGTFLAAAGLFYTMGSYRWHQCLLSSLVLTLVFYGMFVFWLKMPFPTGVFGI
jgi:putative tricarboxylic transport membrane protein